MKLSANTYAWQHSFNLVIFSLHLFGLLYSFYIELDVVHDWFFLPSSAWWDDVERADNNWNKFSPATCVKLAFSSEILWLFILFIVNKIFCIYGLWIGLYCYIVVSKWKTTTRMFYHHCRYGGSWKNNVRTAERIFSFIDSFDMALTKECLLLNLLKCI